MTVIAPSKGRANPSGRKRPAAPAGAIAGEICSERYRHLLAIATRNSLNRDDGEDALQEALLRLLSRFDPDGPAPALPWLTLTLKHECWRRGRAERREHQVEWHALADPDHPGPLIDALPSERPGPEESAERAEAVAVARRRLGSLKPAERRALALHAFGYTYTEICAITGWSYTKVNRCLAEGRVALRALADG